MYSVYQPPPHVQYLTQDQFLSSLKQALNSVFLLD